MQKKTCIATMSSFLPSTLSGAGVSSSFHRNDRPDGGQEVGEGFSHLELGGHGDVDKEVDECWFTMV